MSTEYGSIEGHHEIQFTQYWGGVDRGLCMQITGENCDERIGYVGLTLSEARSTIYKLTKWIKDTRCKT